MKRLGSVAVLCLTGMMVAPADDAKSRYFTCPIAKLEIIDGHLPPPRYGSTPTSGDAVELFNEWKKTPTPFSVQVDGGGSAELVVQSRSGAMSWDHLFLAIKIDNAEPVTGSFRFWHDGEKKSVRWRLPEQANTTRAKDWFRYGTAARLDRTYRPLLRDAAIPGQPWFRHRLHEINSLKSAELAGLWRSSRDSHYPITPRKREPLEPDFSWVSPITVDDWGTTPRWNNRGELAEVLSGGRAISENLQLHRELNVRNDDRQATVKIGDIKGIEIREYEWGPHIQGLRPDLDPLAKWIPADQHAVFFPDVAAALSVMDEIEGTGLAVWNVTNARGLDERLTHRYMKQLALPASQLAKMMPASLVNNVAVTGSDLYFDTGTDVAVLLASAKSTLVRQLLLATWPAIRAANPDAIEKEEVIDGIACKTLITPDRRICSYVAHTNDLVLITNSPIHVRQTATIPLGKIATLDKSAEYIFFRDRYRRGEADESAFVMLTDAAIRRWCGPVWRIGHQRRILTGAFLADAQASHLRSMMESATTRTVSDSRLGPIEVGPHGVVSRVYGTRLFQTPIAETAIDHVSAAEADGYHRWRDSYQQNWSQFFDPIAGRLTVKPEKLAGDVTVMPLIVRSDYRELAALATGASLPPSAGDRHAESLAHFMLGFNRKSEAFKKQVRQWPFGSDKESPVDSWIGDWLAIYVDEDPILDEFAKHQGREFDFWQARQFQIPIALTIAVADVDHLKKFLTGLESQIPGPGRASSAKHRELAYRVSPVGFASFYTLVLDDRFVISPNERVIHRAIDRYLARKDGKPFAGPAWLGDSLAFTAKPQAAQLFREWWGRSALESMQHTAWSNLPVLNEWHNLASAIDSVSFHEKWWGDRLMEPAGGKYVWNESDQTMESTTLGHPGRPKGSRAMSPPTLQAMRGLNFGITFEKEGLRGRFELLRDKPR